MAELRSFSEQAEHINLIFPKLHAVSDNGKVLVRGQVDVVDRDGKYWESFEVEIFASDRFPRGFPCVKETGGKIPKIADWHINRDETCCIGVRPAELLACKDGISLEWFISNEMLPYFFNQTHRRVEGYYPNGEWAHAEEGVFEFYNEKLGTNGDRRKAVELILVIASGRRFKRTDRCICGNGNKFRKCHRAAFEQLRFLDKETLNEHARWIASTITDTASVAHPQ